MAKEIERKYLVVASEWNKALSSVKKTEHFQQGYLSRATTHTVRIRVSSNDVAMITIKGKRKGITRDEFEYTIPVDDGKQLITMCDTVIEKDRHTIRVGKHTWTVDQFYGINKGLLLAEIELTSEDEQFTIPKWVGREVSYDKRYTNSYLTSHKVPTK